MSRAETGSTDRETNIHDTHTVKASAGVEYIDKKLAEYHESAETNAVGIVLGLGTSALGGFYAFSSSLNHGSMRGGELLAAVVSTAAFAIGGASLGDMRADRRTIHDLTMLKANALLEKDRTSPAIPPTAGQ